MFVCSVVYALSHKFSPFSLSKSINQSIKTHFYSAICRERIRGAAKRYYVVQYRRKNTFSCRRDCQLLCCRSAPLLWTCLLFNTCSRYFSLRFLVYTVEFQRVNSQLCVAMMVFAQIYVAQMQMSYTIICPLTDNYTRLKRVLSYCINGLI